MKALFVTTETVDCNNHVRAWDSCFPKAQHFVFDRATINNAWQATDLARKAAPDIIFYIGANEGTGLPKRGDFKQLRSIAPLINICSDAVDEPWHKTLGVYRQHNCFDLQVSIDGALNAPVDHATLTPIDPTPFAITVDRDIRCGFSGSVGRWNARSEIIKSLVWFAGLQVRDRKTGENSYEDHAEFMKRCRLLLNISNTGTGLAHHIKGRVVEAGWAGCALLENEGSIIGEWFPDDCYFTYHDPVHAKHLIDTLTDKEINDVASRLTEEVQSRYTAKQIYQGIIDCVGITESQQTA